MIPKYLSFSFPKGSNIHIGITGSIAAYKVLELIRDFVHHEMVVSVSLTKSATQFVTPISLKGLGAEVIHTDMFSMDQVYAHLYPGIDPEVFLIAPATANIIAKISMGLADDIVSSQALAFNKKIVVAPAMNPRMWHSLATQRNIRLLKDMKIEIIEPDCGDVACGERGMGRLAELDEIFFRILRALAPKDMAGEKVLITLGPTREFWDPIRFWSNPSSGKMGAALAIAAWLRGAEVTCICGPTNVWLPKEIKRINVISAGEMYEETLNIWRSFSLGCLCAAECDFRPKEKMAEKFKKEGATQTLFIEFVKNPDILNSLGKTKAPNQKLIGFAAESQNNFIALAKDKLIRKNLDLIVANQIMEKDSGFEADNNKVVLIDKSGNVKRLTPKSKADVAWEVWDQIFKI